MAKTCATHKDQPSVAVCRQCQKPLCKSCTMVNASGSFCSSECNVLFREMEKMKQGQEERKKMGFGAKFAIFLILVAVVLGGIHLGKQQGITALESIDLVGKLLEGSKDSK